MHSPQENLIIELLLDTHRVIRFPEGIRGFDSVKEFSLIANGAEAPLIWMEAIPYTDLTFIGIDPFMVFRDYAPEFYEKDLASLGLRSLDDMLILCLANPRNMIHAGLTVNLAFPLIINWKESLGRHVLLKNRDEVPWDYAIKQLGTALLK